MPDQRDADLSKLRINREETMSKSTGPGIRMAIVLYSIGAIMVVLAVLFLVRSLTGEPETVETSTASYVSPSMNRTVLTASGYVVAQRKAAIASKATGRIVALYYREGDKVRRGDIIAKIESADVEAALEQARAELAVAAASLFDAKRIFERSDTLLFRSLISQAEFDAARSHFDGVQATVRSREAAVKAAGVALENTIIRAPFDGTILSKNADVGEVVAPFAAGASSRVAVVTIADMASLQVEADVNESNITNVSIRQPVEVTLDAYPERRYRAIVDKIVPTADRAKATVMTKIRFLERDDRVLPEMGAKAHFLREAPGDTSASTASLLVVDARAVVRTSSGSAVFVLEGTTAKLTSVRTGAKIGAMIEIVEGIAQGTKVIVNPPEKLSTGSQVQVQK
ncbi:MAG TPA: efflux RND transporter periplasmic adaptor subunit [Bacteroidota bacterium]|nr:efflux RND transporter periplasmic adaptor subunit [Bacteroidota bacterium]